MQNNKIIDYNSIKDNEIIKISSKNNFENNNNKKQNLKNNKININDNNISDIKNLNNKLKILWVLKNYKYRRKILLLTKKNFYYYYCGVAKRNILFLLVAN